MHRIQFSRAVLALSLASVSTMSLGACSSLNRKEKGGIIGAAAGGTIGGIIGKNNGGTAKGAIIGAAVGGAIGAVIGHQMDQQAKELKQNIPGAVVERVGEGIQVTFASGLLFDFDSDAIASTAAGNLRSLAASLDKYPDSDLLIVGHTDSQGSDEYNMNLSKRRAESTATYLAAQGVDRSRLRTEGKGETEPVTDNSSEVEQARNRRVEVAIYASEAYVNRLKKQNASQ